MSEQNKELARRFYEEVFNTGDVARVDEMCAQDFVDHEEGPPGMPEGIEGVKAYVQMFHEGFSDIRATLDDVMAEGDKVTARVTFKGSHDGEFMGVAATGNRIEIEAIDIVRIVDGKAAEHWGVTDMLGLMQQIGVIPAEAPA